MYRILIVEDDLGIASAVQVHIEQWGLQTRWSRFYILC
jgi:DNA-binding response OmpR family regulator